MFLFLCFCLVLFVVVSKLTVGHLVVQETILPSNINELFEKHGVPEEFDLVCRFSVLF